MSGEGQLTEMVKTMALEAGFTAVAIASPAPPANSEALTRWLEQSWCADMDFMRRNIDRRLDPRKLFDGLESIICLAAGVECDSRAAALAGYGTIARHARGRDYHKVLKARCAALMGHIRQVVPSFEGKAFVDSAPVMERTLAAAAGLGWIGKNGCLFVPRQGSFVTLCEIFCNLPLQAGKPMPSRCGDCRSCIAACPTGAILSDGLVDSRLCISYHTIENRGLIPRELWPRFDQRMFGCDACQEVCPHNLAKTSDSEAAGRQGVQSAGSLPLAEVLAWNEDDWDQATRGKAIRRASYHKFLRNAVIAAGNSGCRELIAPLQRLRGVEGLSESVDWAITRLDASEGKV